jgi:hypothetical protein
VRVTTVDSVLMSSSATLPIGGTSDSLVLTIDAEGFDSRVLRGAAAALRRGDVTILEFEYHALWGASNSTLVGTLAWLHGLGYRCLWQGAGDSLAPISSSCNPEICVWSNVVCAREERLLRVLLSLVDLQRFPNCGQVRGESGKECWPAWNNQSVSTRARAHVCPPPMLTGRRR